jgi:uroporphyrinogen III methyltransferase/synthase
MNTASSFATVYLVGAGPGDPGLLTRAGASALARAAVVVYDFLANPELLKLAPPTAELLYVGKSGAHHSKSQSEIHEILLNKSREVGTQTKNRIVVRLKGGDPYVFGRGGEEAEFLHAHHVPFVVVPGITAGIAAPAYAGIPVTHRDFASTITFITGHERADAPAPAEPLPPKNVAEEGGENLGGGGDRVDYQALAQLASAGGTLVFYMGVKGLKRNTARLIAAGLDPNTPAAVIRWGTHLTQQTLAATLATLADAVAQANILPPAITIVGKVVSLRDTGGGLNWFEHRPLFGTRVLVTRTRDQASALSDRLKDLGAQVLEAPTIQITPPTEDELTAIDQKLSHMPAYDWVVFTSANGVTATWARLREMTFDARHFAASNVAAIGPATAEALQNIGIYPDVIPDKYVAEELAAALQSTIAAGGEEIRHKRFLLLRADIARPALRDALQKMGAIVEEVAIYHTLRPASLPEEAIEALNAGALDWVTFTSASTATNLWEMLTPEQRQAVAKMKRVSIGPITSAALAKLGNGEWTPTTEAREHDIPGVLSAMLG